MYEVKSYITKRGLIVEYEKKDEIKAKEFIKNGIYNPFFHKIFYCKNCNYIPFSVQDYQDHLINKHGVIDAPKINQRSNKTRKSDK